MAVLLQTLYVKAVTNFRYTDPLGGTGAIEYIDDTNITGLRDGNDASRMSVLLSLLSGAKTSGTGFVDVDMDECTTSGVIEFVRYVIRAAVEAQDPGDIPSQVAQMDNSDQTVFNSASISDVFSEVSGDAATFLGLPWTKERVNNAGWFIEQPCSIHTGTPGVTFLINHVSEARLEIWGSAVRLGGYTSYDLNRFDISSPESPILPEAAKKAAQGDLRFLPH